MSDYNFWTPRELETLRAWFEQGYSAKWEGWEKLLPRHTQSSIAAKARKLGLIKIRPNKWSERDDQIILSVIDRLACELHSNRRQLIGHISTLHRTQQK